MKDMGSGTIAKVWSSITGPMAGASSKATTSIFFIKKENEDDESKIDDAFENERMLKMQSQGPDKKFDLKKSSASCKISEIQQIIYGGTSSRFWMLRKHLNTLSQKDYVNNKVPFFSWQCITLQLPRRQIDLVIQNENMMTAFIKLLVHKMNTIDGNKDSAIGVK